MAAGVQPNGADKRPEKTSKTREQKRKLVLTVLLVIAAVLAVLAIGLAALWSRWVVKPDLPSASTPAVSDVPAVSTPPRPSREPQPQASGEPEPVESDEPVQADPAAPLCSGERKSRDYYTVLIFGQDIVSGLTDTVMVASYDVTNQRATVMSIPRDTLINTDGRTVAQKQINAVYNRNGGGEAGVTALKTEVSRLVGFVPDYYVKINWELVGQMVDAIGGVYFDVPWHLGYDDPYQDLHIHFEEGRHYLNGKEAMNLVRWRKNNDGVSAPSSDLARLSLQHSFLKAVLKQTLQPQNVLKIDEISRVFGENVTSDLSVENMFWFASQAVLGGLEVDSVDFITMPCYGTEDTTALYWGRVAPIVDQLIPLINESLNPFAEEVTLRQLDLIQISADGNTLSSTTGILRDPSAAISPSRNSSGQENAGGGEPGGPED